MRSIPKQTADVCRRLCRIFRRELRIFAHRPLFLFTMIVAPVLCIVFFTSLMSDGLPTKLPTALVDEDDTHITHTVVRILDSMEVTDIVAHYANFSEARKAMQRGEIYGIIRIPSTFTRDLWQGEQTHIGLYCDMCSMLYYKILLLTTTNVSLEMNKDIKVERYLPSATRRKEERNGD